MKIRLISIIFVLILALAAVGIASANGNGNSPLHLSESGWDCFDVPGLGVHCLSPGDSFGSPSVFLKVFDTSDPMDPDAHFEGGETLILASLYGGQRCPQNPDGYYEEVQIGPYTYMACHHYSH